MEDKEKKMTDEKRIELIVKVDELKGYVRFVCNIKFEQKEKIMEMLADIYETLKGK